MSKKTNEKPNQESIDKIIDSLDISANATTFTVETKTLAGLDISLDLSKQTFFGIGNIWLSPVSHTCKVPENLSKEDISILKEHINNGIIKLNSKEFIPPITRSDEVLKEYFDFIKQYGLDLTDPKSKSISKFKNLIRLNVDRNWSVKEIVRYCIEQETKYKNRTPVLKLLKNVLDNSQAPDNLTEFVN